MFTADLAWNGEGSELVGERKARKTRQSRDGSFDSSNSSLSSTLHSPSLKDSFAGTPFGSVFSVASSFSKAARKKETVTPPELKVPLRDPAHQPEWTLSATLSKPLPSGATMDAKPPHPLGLNPPKPLRQPEPLGHRAWAISDKAEADALVKSYEKVKETIMHLQADRRGVLLPTRDSLMTVVSDLSVETIQGLPLPSHEVEPLPPSKSPLGQTREEEESEYDLCLSPTQPDDRQVILQTVTVSVSEESVYDFEDQPESPVPPPPPPKSPVQSPPWQAPSNWDCMPRKETQCDYPSSPSDSAPADPEQQGDIGAGSTHFQRLVKRLECAGPKTLLNRLQEEWEDCIDETALEELSLEKHLSTLTALQMKAFDSFAKPDLCEVPVKPLPPLSLKKRRKILEIDGNIGELHQLAAMYPDSTIFHISRHRHSGNIPLPPQATQHPVPDLALPGTDVATYPYIPLPYANGSMHHVRCSKLASLLPAAQLPALIAECHRVLMPGGVLELRIMDAMPDRCSTGPKMAAWLEERLLLRLEAGFKCSRPLAMVPQWVKDAGFKPLPTQTDDEMTASSELTPRKKTRTGKLGITRCLQLPTVPSDGSNSPNRELVVSRLGVEVARALWIDAWGSFVREGSDQEDEEAATWWDDAELTMECKEWKTVWDVATLIVAKET